VYNDQYNSIGFIRFNLMIEVKDLFGSYN